MDVLLKKYFWVIHLATVALCAGLLGRATSHFVEQTFFLGDEGQPGAAVTPRLQAFVPPDKVHAKDADRVIARNVFCSPCLPPPPDVETKVDDGKIDMNPIKTNLSIELVSTMFVPEDPRWSVAIMRDLSTKEKDPGAYNKGKLIAGATVLRVDPKKVYMLNGNHVEYIELEGTEKPKAVAITEPTPAAGAMDPLDADVQKGVHCSGAQCDVERPLLEKLLANTAALATAARFVPSVKDGRSNGFKLYAIRPSSIFGKIGLQNGDTIKAINGMEMASPDQALGVYTKLRTASHLTVQVDRRGETVTLDYTIR